MGVMKLETKEGGREGVVRVDVKKAGLIGTHYRIEKGSQPRCKSKFQD
jgi:hypothetical protein